MYIIRNKETEEISEVIIDLTHFFWINGDQGFNGFPSHTHEDEKIYEISIETVGTGSQHTDSQPVYDEESDTFTIVRTHTDPELTDEMKLNYRNQINQNAENIRLKYITPGDGKAMSYREKLNEAKECLSTYTEINVPAGKYPLLESEVGIREDTTWKMAELVNTTYAYWKSIEVNINRVSQTAIKNINNANTESEAETIIENIEWPK